MSAPLRGGGGTLVLIRGNTALFGTPDGRAYLGERAGGGKGTGDRFDILLPDHMRVKH